VAVLDLGLARRKTPDVKRYYPTNVLVTGWDIIFFWVARMMMMGMHFHAEGAAWPLRLVKSSRFRDGLYPPPGRDEKGREDVEVERQRHRPPWQCVIDDYGGRRPSHFALARGAAHTTTISSSPPATRRNQSQFRDQAVERLPLAEMNDCALPAGFDPARVRETINLWIAHETSSVILEVYGGNRSLSV